MALETEINVLTLTGVGAAITTQPINLEGAVETFIWCSADVRVYLKNWNGVGAALATEYFFIPDTGAGRQPFRTVSNSGYWHLVGDVGPVTVRILQVRDNEDD